MRDNAGSNVLDTSAGRLALILERFSKIGPETKAVDAWTKVLAPAASDALLYSLAELDKLYQTMMNEIYDLPDEDETQFLLEGIQPLEKLHVRFLNLASLKKGSFDNIITPTVLFGLKACSLALRRSGASQPIIEQSDLENLLKDVRGWISSLTKDPDLSNSDKVFIITRLRDVEAALLGFFIGGFGRVEEAVAALTGAAVVREGARESKFLEQVAAFWHRVVGAAQGTKAISDAAYSTTETIKAISSLHS